MRIITIFDDKFSRPLQMGITRKEDDEFTALLHDVLKKHMLEFYGIFDALLSINKTHPMETTHSMMTGVE